MTDGEKIVTQLDHYLAMRDAIQTGGYAHIGSARQMLVLALDTVLGAASRGKGGDSSTQDAITVYNQSRGIKQ